MKNFVDKVLHRAEQLDRVVDGFVNDKLRGGRPLSPKELLEGIVAEIARSVTVSPDGPVLPCNRISITLAARGAEREEELRRMLTPEVIQRAASAQLQGHATVRDDVRVKVVLSATASAPYVVNMRTVATKDVPPPAPAASTIASLVTADGKDRFTLGEGVFNIGRVAEIHGRDGRMVRRNQIVLDGHSASATVSRLHARIHGTREDGVLRFTLFDEGSQRGSVVVRKGQPHKVVAGAVGVRLKDGDEIYLGKACLQFTVRGTRE